MTFYAAGIGIIRRHFSTSKHKAFTEQVKELTPTTIPTIMTCLWTSLGNNYPFCRRNSTSARPCENELRRERKVHCEISAHMIHVAFLSALGMMHHVLCFIFRGEHPFHFQSSALKKKEKDGCRVLETNN